MIQYTIHYLFLQPERAIEVYEAALEEKSKRF